MKNNFFITVIHSYKRYRYKVECIEINNRNEIYKLTAKNKTIILINNRPFLKAKKLKHWKMTWEIEGEIWNVHFQELIIKAIEKVI